jgi:O-antigen ligase
VSDSISLTEAADAVDGSFDGSGESGEVRAWRSVLNGLTVMDGIALAVVAWVPLAYLPLSYLGGSLSLVLGLLLVGGASGLVGLACLVGARDRAAVAAATMIAWSFIVAVLSESPRLSAIGNVHSQWSAAIVALVLGAWALGRTLSASGRAAIPTVLLCALAVNATVGLLQWLVDSDRGVFVMIGGRASGLQNHPVYFGTLMAGAAALAAGLHAPRLLFGALPVGLFAFMANFSGTRVAVLGGLAGALFVASGQSDRRRARITAVGLGYLAGICCSTLASKLLGRGSTALQRTRSAGGGGAADEVVGTGVADRLDVWRWAWTAWRDRPILGSGYGRFLSASQRYIPDSHAARGGIWSDPHNVVLAVLVGGGVVGLALAGWFSWEAARRLDRRLAGFVLAVVATWLLEPAVVVTVLPVAVVLGAAATQPNVLWPHAAVKARGALIVVSLAAAIGLVALDMWTDAAVSGGDRGAADRFASLLHWDAIAAEQASASWADVGTSPKGLAKTLEWQERSVELEPERLYARVRLALLLGFAGQSDRAIDVLRGSLLYQSNHQATWVTLKAIGDTTGNDALVREATLHICAPDGALTC